MLNHHPAKFVGKKHYDNEYMMFLVVEEQDFSCSCLNPPLLFIAKANGM